MFNARPFKTSSQLSFDMWTEPMKEALDFRKRGDAAFKEKDFATAISSYTEVSKLEPQNYLVIISVISRYIGRASI